MRRIDSDSQATRPPRRDRYRPAAFAAWAGATITAIAGTILLLDAYRNQNPDYSCHFLIVDPDALGIDTTVVDGLGGTYGWWPVGLTCYFPKAGGGVVSVEPGPALTVVLLCLVGGVAITLGGLIALGVRRARRERATI